MIHLLPDDSIVTEACSDGLLVLDLTTVRGTFLDRTGAQMWKALQSSSDVDEAVERLHAVFAADRAVLRADLLAFCEHLVAEGLASREPYPQPPQAVAGSRPAEAAAAPCSGPAEAAAAPEADWFAGLLHAAIRDDVAGDVVLLDAPPAAVACVQESMVRDAVDERTVRLATASREHAVDGPMGSSPNICLLWVHTTAPDALARDLPLWLTRVSPGGYVIVSGLEAHVLADTASAVAQPPESPDFVPVEWLTAWWQPTPTTKPSLIATADDTLHSVPPGTMDETDGVTSYMSA